MLTARGGHVRVVEEGRAVQAALLDLLHRVLRAADAGEEHLVLAAGVADRLDDALGHVVVVRVHGVDLLLGLEDVLHDLQARCPG